MSVEEEILLGKPVQEMGLHTNIYFESGCFSKGSISPKCGTYLETCQGCEQQLPKRALTVLEVTSHLGLLCLGPSNKDKLKWPRYLTAHTALPPRPVQKPFQTKQTLPEPSYSRQRNKYGPRLVSLVKQDRGRGQAS